MAAARERGDRSTPYDDVGGFGKFQKRSLRRSSKPYDRPPTAIRASAGYGTATAAGRNNGWLSKLVDPAHRLITSSAHMLFAPFFRKQLPSPPPPPPQLPAPEANPGVADEGEEAVLADAHDTRVAAINRCEIPGSSSERDGVTELELILKQKTFTRSEIDRLTALLQSRTVDFHVRDEEKKSEAIASKAMVSEDRKEFPNTPVKENGIESRLISTPAISSSVLDEDVASPAELAKAYMGSRSSKVSPSMQGLHSEPLRKESAAVMNHSFPSTSPITSVVPKSSGHGNFLDNGFVTPGSRGRSAIYNMARTPYSRVHSTATLQGYGSPIVAFGGPSKSAWNWESNRFSGSKQGSLKRRSSVLDNDIGSAGPIRRIRQKANLVPASGTLSIRRTGSGYDAAAQQPSSTKRPLLAGESSKENGENSLHGCGFASVPFKSIEMASKILQQLGVVVPSREKSPAKLSPSMLRGPALRSLENVDSSKLLENVQENNRSDVKHDVSLPDTRGSMSQKQDKTEENGTTKFITHEKLDSATNSADATSLLQNSVSNVKTTVVMNSVVQPPSQTKQAFQMSAHEDYVELDDDDFSNGTKSTTLAPRIEKPDMALAKDKNSTTEVITVEKPSTFSELNHTEGSMRNQKTMGTTDVSVVDEMSGFTFPNATLSGATIMQQAAVNSLSTVKPDEPAESKKLDSSPSTFTFEEKPVSPKEPNGPTSDFGYKTSDKISPFKWASSKPDVSVSAGLKLTPSLDHKPESSSNVASITSGVTESMIKVPEADSADDKDSVKACVFVKSPETVPPSVSTSSPTVTFSSFGTPPNSLPLNNGSLLSASVPFSSPSLLLVSNNVTSQNSAGSTTNAVTDSSSATPTTATTTGITSSSSLPMLASTPSIMATHIFNFGSSVVPSSSSVTTVGVEPTEAKTKETVTGKVTPTAIGGASSAMVSTGNSLFSGTSAAITGNPFGGTSAITTTGSTIFSFNGGTATSMATAAQSQGFDSSSSSGNAQAPTSGTGFAALTQSIPIGSSSSFGLAGSTAFSSGASVFNSSTTKPFSSGAIFGLTSSTSSADANSISPSFSTTTTTTTPLPSYSWQTPKASIFGSTSNSSSSATGFTFGASSTTNTASSGTPMVFGSSTNPFGASSTSNASTTSAALLGSSTTASSPIFSFSSATASTQSQPLSVNSIPNFAFGATTSPGNNDQMNMEDSMAEDTMQATMPTVPVFNQPNVPPSNAFVFATTGASGGNSFGAATLSGANPFQFGSQSNTSVPQTPSPLQASNSLEFNAAGSFSLGSGGGGDKGRRIVKINKNKFRRR